jgi:trans-aconitate 2-methyltransferase
MSSWDANLYLQFADERTQPSIDLVARITAREPRRIVDLGCGPGNSTEILRRRWPNADLIGVDHSPDMIAAARSAFPAGKWLIGNISTFQDDQPFDIVFSNAALQWVPNHHAVFPHLWEMVAPGGVLAVQVPVHLSSPLHQLILEIANDPIWQTRLTNARTAIVVGRPENYYEILQQLGARIEMWVTEYYHIMEDARAIVSWIRGTGLRPFLQALADDNERQMFLDRLLEGVARAYPCQKDGRVLFPFRRLFLLSARSEP